MQRRILVLTLAIVAVAIPGMPPAVLADDLSKAQGQQQNLQDRLGQLKQKIGNVQGQEAQTRAQLDGLSGLINAAEARLASENAKLDSILGHIEQTQRDLEAKRAEQARRQDVLNHRTRSLYKQGGSTSFIDSLFSASTFSDLLDRFMVMRDIAYSDELLLKQIQDDRVAIEGLVASLGQDRDQQKSLVASVERQTRDLNGQYAQASALRTALGIQHASLAQQQAEAQRALKQVSAEIAALVEARKRARSSGIFAWPLQGPITQYFGCSDYSAEPAPPPGYHCPPSRPYFHTGLDIGAAYGSEITAADSGIAYTYSSYYGYGQHVIIVHANGYATLYGHMSGFAVSNGVNVGKGQRIGFEGSTGNSSGPHLHFEVRLNDAPQDPCRYVGC
jgi:murein DD-endopeptidase MepM/ murein hydrolase activator NlpD